jgi:drug/metabolite transporter (DMT)-like permease
MNKRTQLSPLQISVYTAFALMAFAANSVLNRLALGGNTIDASSYISIRLVSGAIALILINGMRKKEFSSLKTAFSEPTIAAFAPAFYLFLYGIAFSFAYRNLSSGTGAFILFGTVQATILSTALIKGERPRFIEWLGLIIALSGLIYLVLPGLAAPDPFSAFLMALAGISWGLYTLKGRGVSDPIETTALNFIRSVPMILVFYIFTLTNVHSTAEGVIYALISGIVTSAVGYAVWYTALKGLTTTQSALLQLFVPIIAALGGVVFLSESLTMRLLGAGLMILGGVVLALFGKKKF